MDGAIGAAQAGATGAAVATAGTTAAGTLAVGGLANTALSVALSSFAASVVSQAVVTGQVDLKSDLLNGVVAGLTAGLTNGITFDSGTDSLGFNVDAPVAGVTAPSLASLSGVQNVGSALVPQAGAVAGSLPETVLAVGADATIQAGLQTAIEGGSFLSNLKTDGVNDVAADIAYGIGQANTNGDFGTGTAGEIAYAAAHGLLGCAASAAEGTGCAGGAIGGAVSAATANTIATAVTGGQGIIDPSQLAAITAATMLLGGAAAGLAGANPLAGATAAENETLNNTCAAGHNCGTLTSAVEDTGRALVNTPLAIVEGGVNLFTGAVPGGSDYVPFLQGLMLPYDDPDFGGLVSIVGTAGLGSVLSSATSETTTLYRAVGPAELTDIQNTGILQNLGSAEGKYFTTSSSAASSYAQQAVNAFGDPAYTTITTQIPSSVLNGIAPVTVDGGIPAYVVPNELLPGLKPSVSGSMALPGTK